MAPRVTKNKGSKAGTRRSTRNTAGNSSNFNSSNTNTTSATTTAAAAATTSTPTAGPTTPAPPATTTAAAAAATTRRRVDRIALTRAILQQQVGPVRVDYAALERRFPGVNRRALHTQVHRLGKDLQVPFVGTGRSHPRRKTRRDDEAEEESEAESESEGEGDTPDGGVPDPKDGGGGDYDKDKGNDGASAAAIADFYRSARNGVDKMAPKGEGSGKAAMSNEAFLSACIKHGKEKLSVNFDTLAEELKMSAGGAANKYRALMKQFESEGAAWANKDGTPTPQKPKPAAGSKRKAPVKKEPKDEEASDHEKADEADEPPKKKARGKGAKAKTDTTTRGTKKGGKKNAPLVTGEEAAALTVKSEEEGNVADDESDKEADDEVKAEATD
ncbi:hypothetical protein HRR90_002152 [Exophiala dermatitidis]|nr:hypothetical protein HRR76_005093 [Exophiala dermatitidis]KAJ4604558.1 hypothetical protein HRR84_001639 [Exophiala dermatitidis]KAJ4619187.1 hypothetical protein HRR85_002172 [Exophiala dermatitidis]KAJ4633912.1 hypothetical protein HRR86_001381 [Exophiala dermatitidis]KAJ4650358.1 hypothetical protein HRR89_000436 [Exophiala dermatitidis]